MSPTLDIPQIANHEWVKHWAGQWSILSCTFFGHQYTDTVRRLLNTRVRRCIILFRNGNSTAYFEASDLASFGNFLAYSVEKNNELVVQWCQELKRCTDAILSIIQRERAQEPSREKMVSFIQALYKYSQVHIAVKKVVDYLSPEDLQKFLPILEDARLYSEPVYTETEKFMQGYANHLGKKTNLPSHLLLSMKKEELINYFSTGELPAFNDLEKRYSATALVFDSGEYFLVSGREVDLIENAILNKKFKGELRGAIAFPGKARGRIRVILDPTNVHDFKEGEILVTGMTRPEYLSFFRRAAAVITDAGGVLSHAAITARELKKPTIIGTLSATKVLNDGDWVEVDADRGIIRKE